MGLKWTLKMGLRNECDERRDPVRAPPGTHYCTCHTRAPPAGNHDTSRPRRGDDETARLKTRSVPAFRHRRDRPGQHSDNIGTA